MRELTTFRLYLLRALYALIAVGLAITVVPLVLRHPADVDAMRGVVRSLLGALAALCLLGIRYPVKMLPLLLFEFLWKSVWIVAFFLPAWLGHAVTPDIWDTFWACLMGVVLCPLVIPWPYVWAHYVKAVGDRWGGQTTDVASTR
jgi:hypothetical protein